VLIGEVLDGLVRHVFKFVTIWLFSRLDVNVAALDVNFYDGSCSCGCLNYNPMNRRSR